MTVFETTEPCKDPQFCLNSKGFEFISKIIPENRNRKRKEANKRKGPGARNLAQQWNRANQPTRGIPFPPARASARVQPLTGGPHFHLAHVADKRASSTSASSPPARPVHPQSTRPFSVFNSRRQFESTPE